MPKKKILIIEDEQTLIKALLEGFKEDKYEVEVAYDGEEGLEKVKQFKPDLILLDLILPKIDGFTLLNKIRQDGEGKDVPVVVLTNLADVADKCTQMGASECLVKSDETIDNVRNVVKQRLAQAK